MAHRFGILRRFRFNLPQRIAAVLLAIFLLQGFWLTSRQTLTDRDYQYARCGRETWEKPSPLAGYYTSCGNIHDGILAYRLAGLPLTLNLLAERGTRPFPQAREPGGTMPGSELSTWELRHQMTHILLLLRLPFLFAGCVLGGCIWWVTRRLYGNLGGYTALALYCFSPAVLKACVAPNPEVLAALGVYGGVYTCIGVAHAMQGPRRKWRPRIVLLTVIFGIAAAAHIVALPVAALLGLAAMLWVAEGHRSQTLPVVLAAAAARWCWCLPATDFRPMPTAMSSARPRGFCGFLWIRPGASSARSQMAASRWPAALPLVLYLAVRRSRYYGNTAPLLCALVLHGACDDRLSGKPVAVVAAVSAYVCGRRLRRRIRRPPRTPGARRGRSHRAAAGSAVRVEPAGLT